MNARPGSAAWLLAYDLTLNWRRFLDMFGRLAPGWIWAICIAGGGLLHLLAWPVVVWLVRLKQGDGAAGPLAGPLAGAVPIVCILAWMSAQGLLGTARALQERASMDLLLASPLPARLILASRMAAIAAGSFGAVGLLILPVANMGLLLDGPAWLAVYPALLALALIGTIVGMAVAIGLFAWCDPRRARMIAQLCAAFIGGAFLLSMQIAAMLPAGTRGAIAAYFASSHIVSGLAPVTAAAQGELAELAAVTVGAGVLFVLAVAGLSAAFVRASLRAAGGAGGGTGGPGLLGGRRSQSFGSGLAQTLRRKEWRLLSRDQSVFAQLSLQIIYTLPLAVVLLRSADDVPLATALAPTIVVIAAQVSASLAWIAVSGEDAPELIAAAPVRRATVEQAKVTAIGVPVLAILAIPLLGVALLSPTLGLLVALFAAGAGVSTALLNLWHPMPGNRRGMLRRHSQSRLMALLEHLLALLWAVAVFLAVIGSAWAVLPIGLVVLVLASCRPAGHRLPARG